MSTDSNEYWFPAKRYGWGWGLPSRWQGWAVLVIYAVLLGAGIVGLHPGRTQSSFVLYVLGVQRCCYWSAGGRESRHAGVGGGTERSTCPSTAQIRADPFLQQGDEFGLHEHVVVGNIQTHHVLAA